MFAALYEKLVLVEEVVPFKDRSPEEQEKIEDYSKPMSTDKWKEDYKGKDAPHWMEDEEPSPLADKLIKFLKGKKSDILEIGCGNGRDAMLMAQAGHNVVAVDVAAEPIKIAQERGKDVENLTFEVGDAEELKYSSESFDAVYSVAALGFSLLQPALREIYRVLRPKGVAMLFLYTSVKTGDKEVYGWSPDRIKEMIKEEGFTIKTFRENHRKDAPIKIPGVSGEIQQDNHFVITTLVK